MRREKTLDRLARAFAESVEELDFEAAEGWFATARLQVEPQVAPRPATRFPREQPRRARRSA